MVNHIDKKSSDDANKNKVSLYRKYTKFLNNSRAGETSSHVHMESKHGFKGKFTIDSKDQDEFMDLYKQVIFFKDVHLLERQKEVGPLIIDIDFRFKSNTPTRSIANFTSSGFTLNLTSLSYIILVTFFFFSNNS